MMVTKGTFMDCKHTLIKLYILVLSCFYAQVVFAGSKPLFTISVIQKAPNSIASNQSATATYRVTNNTKTTKNLVMQAISGVNVVTTTTGACGWPIILDHGGSCILNLTINGAAIPDSIISGPIICKAIGNTTQANSGACSQPIDADSLRITKAPAVNLSQNG